MKLFGLVFLINATLVLGINNCESAGSAFKKVAPGGLVYSRVPRTVGKHLVTKKDNTEYLLHNPDVWDALPDVVKRNASFTAPGQLIHREDNGNERIIFDCFTAARPCVPMDSAVSLDGTKIAFSVYSSDSRYHRTKNGYTLPNMRLSGRNAEAQILIYNLITRNITSWPHTAGVHDTAPTWLPDGKIMFTSTRLGHYAPFINRNTPRKKPEATLFIANEDGSGAVSVGMHDASALHPFLLDNGRVMYSEWWMSHNLPFIKTNGSINWAGTPDNMWVVGDIDYRGGDATKLLGSHRVAAYKSKGEPYIKFKALHFIGQRNNGDVCVANYYRGNNNALGDVFCWTLEPKGVEGPLKKFQPRNIYSLALWSESRDIAVGKIGAGKIGFPEGAEDGGVIISLGRGLCSTSSSGIPKSDRKIEHAGTIGCDVGLYKTTVIPSVEIGDLEIIVDRPDWHEFAARVIKMRVIPKQVFADSGECILASSDAGVTDAHDYRKKGYRFNHNFIAMANNGSEVYGLPHSELAAIRFYEVIPNKHKKSNKNKKKSFKNSIGNKIRFIGDAPLLTDNSFKVALPCDTPYLMAGVDKDGLIIKRDQIAQSLRPGETRACEGCHLHSQKGRPYKKSLAYNALPLPLLNSEPVPTFDKDITSIMKERCLSCHNDDVPVLNYKNLVWDFKQKSVPDKWKIQVSNDTDPGKRYGLQRPYTSKYVNSMFARESLLYWKAANKRTDGRTDSTFDDDINYGRDHPTEITKEELRTLAAWLDSGASM